MSGQRSLVKRIQQIQEQIGILEECQYDETLRKELIEQKQVLKKYYTRKLKNLKWNLILKNFEVHTDESIVN